MRSHDFTGEYTGTLVSPSRRASITLPSTFLNPANRMTAEDGRRLMDDGERVIEDAEADISRGNDLIKDARARRKKGEALMSRGRQALQAAAMGEEAERLARKSREFKREALP